MKVRVERGSAEHALRRTRGPHAEAAHDPQAEPTTERQMRGVPLDIEAREAVLAPSPSPYLAWREPGSPRHDAFLALAARLVAVDRASCVGVTSAARSEGRTTVALNVAVAFAELDPRERVLYVEASERGARLVDRIALEGEAGLDSGEGLAGQLARWSVGELCRWRVVRVAPRVDVVVLERGSEVGPALALGIAAALPAWRAAGYDRIVVDAPALADGAPFELLLPRLDASIVSVRAGFSRIADVERVVLALEHRFAGCALLA